MTTILFAQNTFAWDSQATWGSKAILGCEKVFENGGAIFGVGGSARTADVIQYMNIPEQRKDLPSWNARKWIVNDLVPAIIESLGKVNALEIDHSQAYSNSHIILHVDGITGYLSGDMAFCQDESGVYGVGSGSAYALGAYHAGAKIDDAVLVATELDIYSGGDVAVATVEELLGVVD